MKNSDEVVIFIQPPANYSFDKSCLPTGYPGIGILSLIAYLNHNKIKTKFFNLGSEKLRTVERLKILNKISSIKAQIFCVSLNWIHMSLGCLETARFIKEKNKNATIVIGGQFASIYAEEISREFGDIINFIIKGEAETHLLNIIKGKYKKENRCVILENTKYHDINIDDLPNYKYHNIIPSESKYIYALNTTRGFCIKNCIYCLESEQNLKFYKRKLTLHNNKWIINQLKHFFINEKRPSVTIQDQFFIFKDKPAIMLFEAIKKNKMSFEEFNIFSAPNSYSKDTYRYLSNVDAKIISIDLGIETNIFESLKILGRNYSESQIIKDIQNITSFEIIPYTWWMYNLPHENENNIKEKERFILETMKLGAIPRWITPLVLLPNLDLVKNQNIKVKYFFNSFRDLMLFSQTPWNKYGIYPALTTHYFYDSFKDIKEIYFYIMRSKLLIKKNMHILEKFYSKKKRYAKLYKRLLNMYGLNNQDGFDLSTYF